MSDQTIVARYEPPRWIGAYSRFVDSCFQVSRLEFRVAQRSDWQNHAAALGVAMLRAGASIRTLVESGNTHGVPSLTRELYEIGTRFVNVISHRESAWLTELNLDIKKLRGLSNARGPWDFVVREQIGVQEERKRRLMAAKIEAAVAPAPGTGIGDSGRDEYAFLNLGTHNNASALEWKYNHQWTGTRLDPYQQEHARFVCWYLRMSVRAMSVAILNFLDSDLYDEGAPPRRNATIEKLRDECFAAFDEVETR